MEQRSDESESKPATGAVDFAFLAKQTFADPNLEREILLLFVTQARRVTSSLSGLNPRSQADAVHLLKGSARGIGAWDAAASAERYEAASGDVRPTMLPSLIHSFAATVGVIEGHLFSDSSRC